VVEERLRLQFKRRFSDEGGYDLQRRIPLLRIRRQTKKAAPGSPPAPPIPFVREFSYGFLPALALADWLTRRLKKTRATLQKKLRTRIA